eukprot:snap_masked-scaffold590_size129399-processed-gene-0.3 protein:Tk08095 transcript:snap_masked-scaffold590_size129399-processed-gene-0.3-mRNA-1 annotation:"AGAP010691-PA"
MLRSLGVRLVGPCRVGSRAPRAASAAARRLAPFRILSTSHPPPIQPDEIIQPGGSPVEAPNSAAAASPAPSSPAHPVADGPSESHEFQAETRQLLDIVARSLYSEKEVFIRELISNASDAIEKMRYLRLSGASLTDAERDLAIRIETDKVGRTITIGDSGLGMSQAELMSHLGTIARSGSKAFLAEAQADAKDIIGQFGVGFYSAFMVAERVDVFSRSSRTGQSGYHWASDGSGTYTLGAASDVAPGTRIVLHLKPDCAEFADETRVRDIVKKYSSFVGSDLYLNGQKANELRPLWLLDPREVEPESHKDFYRYVANAFDNPRFTYHFRTDAPMDIRALLYVPETRPGLFEANRQGAGEVGVALYCRKVLIKSQAENVVPKWMRFVKGVVDSEDIPLNLSRELLQDSAQIRKLRTVITNKFLRFIQERARKEPASFLEFYQDYGFFFKEGIITSHEQYEKEELAKVLRFESSTQAPGELVALTDYCGRMKAGQRDIYYLSAPSRQLAEHSPYFEALKKKDVEILFCYESYDELVLMQLQQFDKKNLTSVEKEMRMDNTPPSETPDDESGLSSSDQSELVDWVKSQLGTKVAKVKTTTKLESHPCVVTVEEMAAARHFVKTQGANYTEEQRYNILQTQFEINPSHPVIKKLNLLKTNNPKLANLLTEQLFANAMVSAGLVEDPRILLKSMNELLTEVLEKH